MVSAMTGKPTLGWGQTVKHFWCNPLLISALLSKSKEVVGENFSVAPRVLGLHI